VATLRRRGPSSSADHAAWAMSFFQWAAGRCLIRGGACGCGAAACSPSLLLPDELKRGRRFSAP